MQDASSEDTIGFSDAADFARAREVLSRAGYTDAAMREIVGGDPHTLPPGSGPSLVLGKTETGSPREALVLLFLLGAPVEEVHAQRALRPMRLETWAEAGLVRCAGGRVESLVRLVPFRGLWLAFDRPHGRHERDFVMGVGASTVWLMDVTIRRPIRAMLDLGTGCGTHALVGASHSATVLAADLNGRAVGFARFNARLNGLENVETATGDLFEPVAGRAFDLVVSNPPYVVSPESRYRYRDGGLAADGFCRRLVREVPSVLAEGGFCQILCDWAHTRGEDWRARLRGWFEGTGLDAWIIRRETTEASAYAGAWIRRSEGEDPVRFAELQRRWIEFYAREGIERISSGIITMRRRAGGTNWIEIDEEPPRVAGPCGGEIARRFDLRDFLESAREDERLLQARPRVAPTLRLEQRLRATSGAWEIEAMEILLEGGLEVRARVDPVAAGFLSRCDGMSTMKELIAAVAADLGESPEAVGVPLLGLAREMIAKGFLLPDEVGD